ncbi:MAG: hypothetical protein R2867_42695 [Caldilineaceae bacterium]
MEIVTTTEVITTVEIVTATEVTTETEEAAAVDEAAAEATTATTLQPTPLAQRLPGGTIAGRSDTDYYEGRLHGLSRYTGHSWRRWGNWSRSQQCWRQGRHAD